MTGYDGFTGESKIPDLRESLPAGGEHGRQVEKLFHEHNHALLRFVSNRLHSEQEAREIVQEAYVRLLKLDETNTISYLRAYLFRIATNLVTDRLKQRDRRGRIDQELFFDHDGTSPPPETTLTAEEVWETIRTAIDELPPKCRKAFLLHRVHEMSIEETATEMQVSGRMVRYYVAQALAHCKSSLDAGSRSGDAP